MLLSVSFFVKFVKIVEPSGEKGVMSFASVITRKGAG